MSETSILRTPDATLTDLVVQGCLFDGAGELASIIDVEKCPSDLKGGTIRLHRVGFRDNRFSNAVAIKADSSSCSKLEIEDFNFRWNFCDGVCGLLLAKENRLRHITIEENRPISSLHSRSVIVRAPPQSATFVEQIRAYDSSGPIFEVEEGSFNLSNGNFTENLAAGVQDASVSACIKLKDASALIRDSSFEENKASYGAAINARGSNVTLKTCAFRSNVADMKGTVLLRNGSSLTIDSSLFSSNRAEMSGGAIDAQKTELNIVHLICTQNEAGLTGGCLHVDVFSSAKMSNTILKRNRARSGGALFIRDASVVIRNSRLLSNHADEHGGGIHSKDSRITAMELTADGNYAELGGGSISTTTESNLTVYDSLFKNSYGRSGGAVQQSENSVGMFVNVTFENNEANHVGGSVSANHTTLIIRHSGFRDGIATSSNYEDGGGFLSASHDSSVFVQNTTMTDGSGGFGGAIQLESSTFEADDLVMLGCSAIGDGGAIRMISSSFEATNTNVSECNAWGNGGAIQLESSVFKARGLNVSDCETAGKGGAVNADRSAFLCVDCLFVGNSAENGGAISIDYFKPHTAAIHLQGDRILNNTADYGGECAEIARR